jgi:hypothetical protein
MAKLYILEVSNTNLTRKMLDLVLLLKRHMNPKNKNKSSNQEKRQQLKSMVGNAKEGLFMRSLMKESMFIS